MKTVAYFTKHFLKFFDILLVLCSGGFYALYKVSIYIEKTLKCNNVDIWLL